MTELRTFVDENRFIFTSDSDIDGFRAFIAVHWTAHSFAPDDSFLRPLREFLRPRHEIGEVWLVFPEDLTDSIQSLRALERFPQRDEEGIPRLYRFFAVNGEGAFQERWSPGSDTVDVESSSQEILEDGLRQMFRETGALATPTAGFHFAHPSGTHSKYFIRASQAVSRQQHVYFMAMALLRRVSAEAPIGTVWVDTAGIAVVGYAYSNLLRRLSTTRNLQVETFGGYRGIRDQLRPTPSDLVLISGSTSGSLARKVIEDKKVQPERVVTLFMLGVDAIQDVTGLVLCDLARHAAGESSASYDSRIQPYGTESENSCSLCNAGGGTILLEGDSFFPAATSLELRMPSFFDRPYDGKVTRTRTHPERFDGSDYFEDLFGHEAITYFRGTPVDRSVQSVSTRLGSLLNGDSDTRPMQRIAAKLDASVDDAPKVSVVLSLLDPDSVALGSFAAKRMLGIGCWQAEQVVGEPWRVWFAEAGGDLAAHAAGGTVLVCAAVLGSGRLLTSASRELRKVPGEFHLRYFVGAAHPTSSTTWATLKQTLKRTSSTETSRLTHVWLLPREPRFPGAPTPWTREQLLLEKVAGKFIGQSRYEAVAAALEPRLQQLESLDSNTLFVGAKSVGEDVAIATINPKFSLWPFAWNEHAQSVENGAIPTHAETFATLAHLLYESRRYSPSNDSRIMTARRHGYALNPAIFDRFNDPVIQAALLRAAEPGELHYETDVDASRAVADLLCFVMQNLNAEAGNAGYELLLALAEGQNRSEPYGLRLDYPATQRVVEEAHRLFGVDLASLQASAPKVWALLLYIEVHVSGHDQQ